MAGKKKKRQADARKGLEDQVIKAAFKRVEEYGWRRLTLYDISQDTDLTMEQLLAVFPNKAALLKAYVQRVDCRALDDFTAEEDDSTRDQLFDLMMRRFDEMDADKAALKAIAQEACCDPNTICVSSCGLLQSMQKVLVRAGIKTSGLHGKLKIKGLSLIFLAAFRTWLRDNTEDMSKTMAELDKRLSQAEAFEQGLCRFACRRRTSSQTQAAA